MRPYGPVESNRSEIGKKWGLFTVDCLDEKLYLREEGLVVFWEDFEKRLAEMIAIPTVCIFFKTEGESADRPEEYISN